MRFVIDGKMYSATTVKALTLRDILTFNRDAEREGWGLSWGDIEPLFAQVEALKDETEKRRHPGTLWLLALTIWASRRAAGETVSFGECIDIPLERVDFIADPQDRLGGEGKDPRKARPRRASVPAAKPPAKPARSL